MRKRRDNPEDGHLESAELTISDRFGIEDNVNIFPLKTHLGHECIQVGHKASFIDVIKAEANSDALPRTGRFCACRRLGIRT